ncbi:siderophore ABC transporter substrate-binding protein [Sporosarcina thermotolerans]|uniref:Siderophore ABC transporter substrate-binding protein n=1 Tax=Sporosarcina thermotolerans TaxID=633404 RepID=A0AAW9AFM9_9BACL|nr:siderophore ABC transporter substrate-binding protein [Sporosarcina thermotolerans]MDW0117993.1 siderophore ABC transporter substrate-binding protein [Sporosarcina thermotolerans]
MKKLTMTLLLASLMIVLAACGTKNKDEGKTSGTDANSVTETISVEHKLSSKPVEVPKNPQKVVVFDFGTLDTLDDLGIEVAGLPRANVPGYLSKYDDDKYVNVGSLKEPAFEEIHAMKPDLIIISDRQAELYDQFAEIAPTIYVGIDYAHYMDSFKHNAELIGKIFNKEEEVQKELADIDDKIAAIKEKTSAIDTNALIVLASEGKVSAYGPNSRFGLIHDVLGYKAVDEKIEVSTHGQNISFEYIFEKNPDVLFVIDRDAAIGNGASAKDSVENELVKKTDAYKNGKIIYLNGEYWYLSGGGLLSMKEMIKEVEASF